MKHFAMFETNYGSISGCLGFKTSLQDAVKALIDGYCDLVQGWNDDKLILSIDRHDISIEGIYLYGVYILHNYDQNGKLVNIKKLNSFELVNTYKQHTSTLYVFFDDVHIQTVSFEDNKIRVNWETDCE